MNIHSRIILIILTAVQFLASQLLEDPRLHSLVLQGIDQTLRQDYPAAERSFQSMIAHAPAHPSGYLYLAGMLQAKNTDLGDRFDEQRYDSLLNIAEMRARPFLQQRSTAAIGHYYIGCAEAFRSYTRSENGNIASGVYYGLAAGGSLERCLEADPAFMEAKNILGSFYFWRSKLAWIPFVPDRSAEGIGMIEESFSHPYEKHLASHNLMVIFTEEKRYADAERYGLIMLKEYPDNRLFLWNLMTVYEKWGRTKELTETVRRLLNSTMSAPVTNRYTEAVCRVKLAEYALANNDTETARKELRQVTALKRFIGTTKGNLRKKISQAQDILDSIE
ncbi:MAG: hypothetical protein HUU02_08885 [Bacteroidetes bacterium]|nr:hypothetical protein [Bacteroidota bacterium]